MKHTLQHRSLEKQLLFRLGPVLEAAERLAVNNKGESQKGKKWFRYHMYTSIESFPLPAFRQREIDAPEK